ncbi:MAG: hypothetical protein KC877_04945, partial [Candidatus Kaiserbacteria bacterium]|nr:hypothetical protein [Candidatus Kaiserbacteria bacterium]
MSENVFIPKMNQSAPPKQEQVLEVESTGANDAGGTMLRVAQYAVILLAGSIAVFFTPHLWASLGFDKTILAFGLAIVSVISLSLLALRRAKVATVLPISLGIFWVLVMAAMVSGLHSGDIQDAMRGSVFDPQTVGFLAILALTMTISLSLQNAKVMSMKALAFFGLTAIVVLLYNVLRIIFGPAFLGFDSFGAVTVSPIGSFNDLAIFASLVILLGLVTLMQLPLKTWLQSIVAGMIVLALFLLGVINFFNIWIIVGFFSLLLFVFLLSRDTLFNGAKTAVQSSRILLATTAIVCIVSAVFIVAGDYVGNKIGQMTSVNYVEVRPSAEATIGIARAVYSDNLFMGVGPNRFADAWRQHKDPAINETIFWDTDFNAGSGFIPTLFINTGVVGMTLLVLFHLVFLYTGYRMLLRTTQHDPYWYYFGVFSFTAACFLWLMSYIYVPGSAILLLAALFTGFTYVAAGALLPMMVKTVPLAANRRRGFFLMAAIILIITVSIGSLFSVGKQYVAQANFTKARVQSESVAVFDQAALAAFTLYDDPRFQSARAQVQMANLSSLLAVEQPSEEQQQQFLEVAEQALLHAE